MATVNFFVLQTIFHFGEIPVFYALMVPDIKVHVANMGPTWVLSTPGGPHVGHMNVAIWGEPSENLFISLTLC